MLLALDPDPMATDNTQPAFLAFIERGDLYKTRERLLSTRLSAWKKNIVRKRIWPTTRDDPYIAAVLIAMAQEQAEFEQEMKDEKSADQDQATQEIEKPRTTPVCLPI